VVPFRNERSSFQQQRLQQFFQLPTSSLHIIIMTSPAKRPADDAVHVDDVFVPKKKVLIQIGRVNLYVYPNVTPKMGDNERSLFCSIYKTALANARALSYNQKLNHIGELLGCSNLVDIERNVFKNAAFDFIKVNTNLTLISYHNAQGGIINDALDAAGQLMPIQNSAINTCRPKGISSPKCAL
jgi:hypothetical protein